MTVKKNKTFRRYNWNLMYECFIIEQMDKLKINSRQIVMKIIIKVFLLYMITMSWGTAQEIPASTLFYTVNDFGFTLSSDGHYLASVRSNAEGYFILITDIKASQIKNKILLGKSEVSNLNWLSENRVSFDQLGVLYGINIDGSELQQLMSIWKEKKNSYYSVYSMMKNIQLTKLLHIYEDDFEHILVESKGFDESPIVYKLNIYTGEKEEIENGEDYDITHWLVDRKGNVRLGVKEDDAKISFFTKNAKYKWESKNELQLDVDGGSFINQKLQFLDFDYDKNIIFLASSMNSPHWQILRYNIQTKEYLDTVAQDEKYDVGNPFLDDTKLLFLDSESKLVGVRYERGKPYTKWLSKKFQDYEDTLKHKFSQYYPDIFDWNKDASVLLVKLYSDVDPGHIITYNVKENQPLMFCSFAKELLSYNVSPTEIVHYTTRDGYEIEGYMNLPTTKNKEVPFVIIPHGGPWVRDYWRYDPVVQFFANHGYGVLKMNFRGSTGYGVNHLLAGIKQISTVMIDDIADGVQWLINQKYADSSAVYLYGHSYGGYAAMQSIIRYPRMYQAAVSVGAPTDINELMDYYKEQKNKFGYEFWKTAVGDPRHEDDFLDSISTMYNIQKIQCPVFLFHGEKDEVVPVEQTEKFIKKAEKLGKQFDHKIIKDEDHSISENRNTEFIVRKSVQFFHEHSGK